MQHIFQSPGCGPCVASEKKTDAKLLLHHITQDTTYVSKYREGRDASAPLLDWTPNNSHYDTNTTTADLLEVSVHEPAGQLASCPSPPTSRAYVRYSGKQGDRFLHSLREFMKHITLGTPPHMPPTRRRTSGRETAPRLGTLISLRPHSARVNLVFFSIFAPINPTQPTKSTVGPVLRKHKTQTNRHFPLPSSHTQTRPHHTSHLISTHRPLSLPR